MAGRIPEDVLERVLSAHDVVEVVGRYLPLAKAGRSWKALCPFHEEKTASFTVNPDRQTFKCFGCGKGGNVFGFVMAREGLTFPEAVRKLAAEKAIPVPDAARHDPEETSRIEGIRAALALAQDLYVRTLYGPDGQSTRAYLAHRGFPPEAVAQFGLGLSPGKWDGLLEAARAKGLAPTVLEDAGLVLPRESGSGWYDRFRGRLMFPVSDHLGRIVTYGARTMTDEQPKYLNGPETSVFKKGRTLYGLERAKEAIPKAGHAILMEGYTDVLMAHWHGLAAAVAGMGTAFTTDQARLLGRYAKRVVLLYDGDQAGRIAAEKSIDVLLSDGLEVKVALLPEGKDVDEVLLEEGIDRLTAIVAEAKDLFDFKLQQLSVRLDLTSVRGRAQAAEDLLSSAVKVQSPIERDLLFRRIAERLGVPEATLRTEAARRPGGRHPAGPAGQGASAGGAPAGTDPKAKDRLREQQGLVAGVLHLAEHLTAVKAVLCEEEIEDEGLKALWRATLSIADEGGTPTAATVAAKVAGDAAAAEALAGLPEDLAFEEWVPEALRLRGRRAEADRRRSSVLQRLSAPPDPAQTVAPSE